MNVTRRDVLRFAAGGAAGAALTPVPWKALDDVAIWTQNWSWIPKPPKGPATMRPMVCALCPSGCPLEARCIGGLPVSMHASAEGSLCPLGLTGHHLPYHPARLSRTVRLIHEDGSYRKIPVPADAAISAAAGAIRDAKSRSRSVAVLDMRPGRSVSWAWQRFLAVMPRGTYVAARSAQTSGLDPDSVRTIISFRAAMEDTISPRLRAKLLDGTLRLIAIDPVQTTTAARALRWLPVKPGHEGALAIALASELRSPGSLDLHSAANIGLAQNDILDAAREIAENRPAIVVCEHGLGRSCEAAIAELRDAIGNAVAAPDLPAPFDDAPITPPTELPDVEDASISLLLIDMSGGDVRMPWPLVARKLAPRATVVALSPFLAGTAAHADYVIPTLPFLEGLLEIPTPPDSHVARMSIAAPLLPTRCAAVDPVQFIRAIAHELPAGWTSSEELLRARVARIHAAGIGTVGDKSVADIASADEMWDALLAGSSWTGVRTASPAALGRPAPPRLRSTSATQPAAAGGTLALQTLLTLVVRTPRDVTASAAVSPVMTKLYRESGLRRAANIAAVNPTTLRQIGLGDGRRAKIVLVGGSLPVTVAADNSVMPGVVEITDAPDAIALGERGRPGPRLLDRLTVDGDGCWRTAAAQLVEA